jgi:hypothetical protein
MANIIALSTSCSHATVLPAPSRGGDWRTLTGRVFRTRMVGSGRAATADSGGAKIRSFSSDAPKHGPSTLSARKSALIVDTTWIIAGQRQCAYAELSSIGLSPALARRMSSRDVGAAHVHEIMQEAGIPAVKRPDYFKRYSDKNLEISPATVVRGLTDGVVAHDYACRPRIERSSIRPYSYTVERRARPDGQRELFAFEPLPDIDFKTPTPVMNVATLAGFDGFDPQLAMREIATLSLSDLLGFDVIAKTEIACFTLEPGGSPMLGMATPLTDATPASDVDPEILEQPQTMQLLTRLQLVDQLTGQWIGSRRTYLVSGASSPGVIRVVGICNAKSFGTKRRGDAIGPPQAAFPPYIDTEMADAVLRVDHDMVTKTLSNKLSNAEAAMTIERLDQMKAAIACRAEEDRLITPERWSDPAIRKAMAVETANSYWARDVALASGASVREAPTKWTILIS